MTKLTSEKQNHILNSLKLALVGTVTVLTLSVSLKAQAESANNSAVLQDINATISTNETLAQTLSENIQVQAGLEWSERNELENKLLEMAKHSAEISEESIVLVSLTKSENK